MALPRKSIMPDDNDDNNILDKITSVADAIQFMVSPATSPMTYDYLRDEAKSMAGTIGRQSTPAIAYRLATGNSPITNKDVREEYRQKALEDALNAIEIASLFFTRGGSAAAKPGLQSVEEAVTRVPRLRALLSYLQQSPSRVGLKSTLDEVTEIVPEIDKLQLPTVLRELNSGVTRDIIQKIEDIVPEEYLLLNPEDVGSYARASTMALDDLNDLIETQKLLSSLTGDIPDALKGFINIIKVPADKSPLMMRPGMTDKLVPEIGQATTGIMKVIDKVPINNPVDSQIIDILTRQPLATSRPLNAIKSELKDKIDKVILEVLAENQRLKNLQTLEKPVRFVADVADTLTPNLPVLGGAAGLKALYDWITSREPVINMPEPQQPVINTVPFPPTTTTIPTGTFPPRR